MKNKAGPLYYTTKGKNRWILNEKLRGKTRKLIKKNSGGYLYDLGVGKYFITNPSKHKIDKIDY